MSAAMKAFNTNLHLPAQPLFYSFKKSTAYVDRTNRDKPAETRQVRPGRDELGKVANAEYVYIREGRSRHKLDPKYTGPLRSIIHMALWCGFGETGAWSHTS